MTTAISTGLVPWFDWTVPQGELVMLRIPVVDSTGAPYTVTNWIVDAEIKTGSGGATLYTWDSGDAVAAGTAVVLTILPATSLAWMFELVYFRICLQHPADATQRYRILEGRFIVSAD